MAMKLLTSSTATQDRISISFNLAPRHYRFNKHPLEIAIQEKLGLSAIYDDFNGTVRIFTNSSKQTWHEEQLYNSVKNQVDNATVSSKVTVILHLPPDLIPIRQFKGKLSLNKETLELLYKETNLTESFYTSFTYLTDITTELDWPIPTSDGLLFYNVLAYYKAMQVENYALRKIISNQSYSELKQSVDVSMRRLNWGSIQREVLFKALYYKAFQDNDFKGALLGTYPYPLVYFNYVPDLEYNDVLGVDLDKKQYLNLLGQVLMNLRHEMIFNNSTLPDLTAFKQISVA